MEQLQQIILQQNQLITQMMTLMQQQQQPANPIVPQPVSQPAPQQKPPRRKSAWQLYLKAYKLIDRHLYTGENHDGTVGHHAYNRYLKMKKVEYNNIKSKLSIVDNVLYINNNGIVIPFVAEEQPAPIVEEPPVPIVEEQPVPIVEEPPVPIVEEQEQPFFSYSRTEHNDNLYLTDFLMTYNYPDEQHIISRYEYTTGLINGFNNLQVRQDRFECRFFGIMRDRHNNNPEMLEVVRNEIKDELRDAFAIVSTRMPTYRRFNDIPKTNLTNDEQIALEHAYNECVNVWNNLQRRKRDIFRRLDTAYYNVRTSPLFIAQQREQERVRREEFRQQQAELQANPLPPVDTHNENECPICIEAYVENGIHTCGTCNYQMCNVCVEHIRESHNDYCPQCREYL